MVGQRCGLRSHHVDDPDEMPGLAPVPQRGRLGRLERGRKAQSHQHDAPWRRSWGAQGRTWKRGGRRTLVKELRYRRAKVRETGSWISRVTLFSGLSALAVCRHVMFAFPISPCVRESGTGSGAPLYSHQRLDSARCRQLMQLSSTQESSLAPSPARRVPRRRSLQRDLTCDAISWACADLSREFD